MDSAPMPALPSGFKSSEFSLSTLVALLGSVVAIGSLVVGTAQDSGLQLPPWVRATGLGLGLASAVIAKLGYTKSRTVLKVEQLRATVTPMLPQLLQVVNQVTDIVKDIRAGGFTAPAGDPGTPPPALQTSVAQTGGATSLPLQLATVAVKTAQSVASGGTPLSVAIAGAVEQLAENAGAASAAKVKTAEDAAKIFDSTKVP